MNRGAILRLISKGKFPGNLTTDLGLWWGPFDWVLRNEKRAADDNPRHLLNPPAYPSSPHHPALGEKPSRRRTFPDPEHRTLRNVVADGPLCSPLQLGGGQKKKVLFFPPEGGGVSLIDGKCLRDGNERIVAKDCFVMLLNCNREVTGAFVCFVT
ncbi:hypothetical protein TNIN_416081 [Trichonephila inaurata madagascariensis]|uniref:Uncharacterized protein n=1 Tax=Trichonephila inaurata madagascariensis TaxID=2747483 RepID=A0A8X6YCP4_9ARAC|nr:hypothetical protein TNIN_416081 [Trichonephila inaurata madagascariensis]